MTRGKSQKSCTIDFASQKVSKKAAILKGLNVICRSVRPGKAGDVEGSWLPVHFLIIRPYSVYDQFHLKLPPGKLFWVN